MLRCAITSGIRKTSVSSSVVSNTRTISTPSRHSIGTKTPLLSPLLLSPTDIVIDKLFDDVHNRGFTRANNAHCCLTNASIQKQTRVVVVPTGTSVQRAINKNNQRNSSLLVSSTLSYTTMFTTNPNVDGWGILSIQRYFGSTTRCCSSSSSSSNIDPPPTIIATAPSLTDDNNDSTTKTVLDGTDIDEAINKIFEESEQNQLPKIPEPAADAWYNNTSKNANSSSSNVDEYDKASTNTISDDAETVTAIVDTSGIDWAPVWYKPPDHAISFLKWLHETTGLEYWAVIVCTTMLLRVFITPLMILSQYTSSRMSHASIEMKSLREKYDKLGNPTPIEQKQFMKSLQNVFKRYKINPLHALMAPLVQLPLFLSMFFGLKQMPHIFVDDFSTGGIYWFKDLTSPDPYYILPLASSCTFMILVELGRSQMKDSSSMDPKTSAMILNAMRLFSILLIPMTLGFESSMLCYWVTNNTLTIFQTSALYNPAVKKYFGIWDPPKPVPGTDTKLTLKETFSNLHSRIRGEPTTEKEKMDRHNALIDSKKDTARMLRKTRASSSSRRAAVRSNINNAAKDTTS